MDRGGGGTKRSKVWLHFTRESGDRAKCNTCERLISCRPAGCTSNLTRHLKQHGVRGGAEGTVFDVLRSQAPSSSSSSSTTTTAEEPGPTKRKRVNKEKHEEEPAERKRLSKEKNEECHRAVTKFVVKGLHPFSVVESTAFRELTRTLNPNYTPPSRDILSHHLIPAWYKVEKSNVVSELGDVGKVAITSDGWTSMTQDHYLTVTAHYVIEGKTRQKVLKTKPVYKSQTGPAVSEDISDILQEFGIMDKIVAVTVDNATNVNVAIKKRLRFIKLPCLAHTLNLGAQSGHSVAAVAKWTAKIRDVVVWMKRSSLAKILLKEKQQNLNLPQRALILDVRTRWDSPYKMMERFLEQYPAIQAAFHDQRLKKSTERDRLPRLTEDDFRKAEEFVHVMRVLYTSTLCVSSEQSPTTTCAHILPTLRKLRAHFAAKDDDSAFASVLKQAVWGAVWQPYRSDDVRAFLEEAAALDPRFKDSVEEDGAVWERLRDKMAVVGGGGGGGGGATECEQPRENEEGERAEEEEELFPYEDDVSSRATVVQLQMEMELTAYRETPPTPAPSVDPAAWWWNNRTTFPSLSQLASSYLCVQASSTPSERVFSTAGDNICAERSRIQAEKADMLIFLNKNCC